MTQPPFLLRSAAPSDADAISALIDGLAHFFLVDPDDRASGAAFLDEITPPAIRRLLDDPAYRYHVATTDEGTIVGVVAFRDRQHLFHLFVETAYHRRGLARQLFDLAWRTAGSPTRVTVSATPYAVPAYQRLGFVATGERVEQNGIAFVPMARDAG
ncbi:MAG: GNAT family N-acetyltransferase [Acidobacteriota bacterium]